MKPWLKKVTRLEPALIDRSKYLRLDKNERVINFEKKFLNFLKKKLNSYFISAYPETTKIKRIIEPATHQILYNTPDCYTWDDE